MKKFRTYRFLILLFFVALIASGCSSDSSSGDGDGKVKFNLWAAPNPSQQVFWEDMAKQYMKENEDVKIKVSPMPESPSSEAGIQSAIAAGNAPAISEKHFPRICCPLAGSSAVVPLDEFDGYDELLKGRKMEETISLGSLRMIINTYCRSIRTLCCLAGERISLKSLGSIHRLKRTTKY